MKHDITARQLEVLLACYFNQTPIWRPTPRFGDAETATDIWWIPTHRGGGAAFRMVGKLRDQGFVTDYNRYEDFGDKRFDDLTVKGYEALAERHSKLPPYLRRLVKMHELSARRIERELREAEIERLRFEKIENNRAQDQARAAAARQDKLTKLRELFAAEGLGDNWSDDQLLDFAERIASL